ncbi:uncharacterized protein A4U43_C02F7260 [Asparagus officinalis]|uniref:Magnesium transporter n=1 Tax=Asparagus officinalis TaxID=4686 RepID=A0A5P1FHG1_ASPOF|nr:uncharacterized protein A4U43_C02F7260 [Asparagus officinalis]
MRTPATPPPQAASSGGRRKGTAIRALEEVGKHSIMRRTGLPARDLRVLDPMLSYPSTILGRERAIVINLEHIKAVITATEVLVPNSTSPLVGPFVQELQARVSAPQQTTENGETGRGAMEKVNLSGKMAEGSLGLPHSDVGKDGGAKMVPFEFRALEVCLESACKCLESETLTLEKEAYPALDELTSKISTLNLERVRQIKSRLVALSGRVQKVRDELEHLLDDDMDMAEMYLTEKLMSNRVGEMSSRGDLDNDGSEMDEERDEDFKNETESSHGSYIGFKPSIEELEMLLEAYFVQIDGTLNKLSTLREYVDDTEDYINIMLDEKQNQLLQMGVMLSTLTLVLTAGVVVVGIFGMNIGIDLYNAPNGPYHKFWETTFSTFGGCVVLYILAIGWGLSKGVLEKQIECSSLYFTYRRCRRSANSACSENGRRLAYQREVAAKWRGAGERRGSRAGCRRWLGDAGRRRLTVGASAERVAGGRACRRGSEVACGGGRRVSGAVAGRADVRSDRVIELVAAGDGGLGQRAWRDRRPCDGPTGRATDGADGGRERRPSDGLGGECGATGSRRSCCTRLAWRCRRAAPTTWQAGGRG